MCIAQFHQIKIKHREKNEKNKQQAGSNNLHRNNKQRQQIYESTQFPRYIFFHLYDTSTKYNIYKSVPVLKDNV